MTGRVKIAKICRWSALGLLALILSLGGGGRAMADCASFPKIALWSELTHDFVLQYVDDKYDGDWGAYLVKLERYESKLKGIHDKGLRAGVTWRDKKVHLKGAKLADFLKLFGQRLAVTRCLAENQSIADFSTAAGGTDGGNEMNLPESKQCGPFPQVAWWKFKSHESVTRYIARKYRGDWESYIGKWSYRLAKLQDIYDRESGAVTSNGILLKGQELFTYIGHMQKRISVVRCLAKETNGAIL